MLNGATSNTPEKEEGGGEEEQQEEEKQEVEQQEEEPFEKPSNEFHQLEQQVEEQVVLENGNNNFPAIWSEEGKYLASVLGDALVKGLSLVSQQRPTDPVEYLANFLRTYKEGEGEESEENMKEFSTIPIPVPIPTPGQPETTQEEEQEEEEVEQEQAAEPEPMEEETEVKPEEPLPETEVPSTTPVEAEPSSEAAIEEPPPTESGLNSELHEGYDKLEDALDEEEAEAAPFDPEKEELAEKALLESSRSADPTDDGGDGGAFALQSSTRDENGQSVLHFACTRPGGGSTIMAFLQNPSVNLAWRDFKLRTARDVAENLNRGENMRVVDNWVLGLATKGDLETLEGLLIDGYDHIADVEDSSGTHIVEVAENAGFREVALLLRAVPEFRERVERIHRCVRSGDVDGVRSLVGDDKRVAFALNPRTGRNVMHVAVLCEEVGIVKWLGEMVPECVKKGDNLERTCLHYAMGVDKVEKIVRLLVRAGAKRVVKDLRDRQPSWYFINRDEIGQLQAEERAILN